MKSAGRRYFSILLTLLLVLWTAVILVFPGRRGQEPFSSVTSSSSHISFVESSGENHSSVKSSPFFSSGRETSSVLTSSGGGWESSLTPPPCSSIISSSDSALVTSTLPTTVPLPTTSPVPTSSTVPTPSTEPPVSSEDPISSPSSADPEERSTILHLLKNALLPLGKTMYVWGGGWNEEDTGAGTEATTIGVSPLWAEFAMAQDENYDYRNTRYQIHNGLDCSGYMGWVVYNTLETENGREGYVMSAGKMAASFAKMGLGSYTEASEVQDWQAGDIMSMNGHVWMAVGMCADGSAVLLHCSPPGVVLSGTALKDGGKSQAEALAERYMKEYYPEWYEKFPDCQRSHSYLTRSSRMRWSREILSDEEGLSDMSAEQVLAYLFGA